MIEIPAYQHYITSLALSFQALLHAYFFAEPLPAHHSELVIPSRSKKMRQEFGIDRPITETLIDPDLIAPYITKRNH